MQEKDFDLKLSMKVRELVHDYGIKLTHEEIIPDGATADAIFNAGVDFLVEVGLYNADTNRVLRFTREETLNAAQETPSERTLGYGKDWMTIRARKHDEKRPPTIKLHVLSGSDDDRLVRVLKSFAQEKTRTGREAYAGV